MCRNLYKSAEAIDKKRRIYYDKDSIKPVSEPIPKPILHKKQQRTGQAPGGFTDASAAGNSPRFRGLGRAVAELGSEG